MADVIDFQGRHRPDLRKPWIFVLGIEETGQRAQLPPRWWKCRSWEGSVTGSCSFSLEIFLFFIFFFLDTICLDIVVCIGLSRPLCLAEGGNESQFVFGDVWRRRMMFGDDVPFEGFFLYVWILIIFARIWLCFTFEDFELFSSNCKEIIELKNVKWFSNDFLWFKESEKNRYVKINIF